MLESNDDFNFRAIIDDYVLDKHKEHAVELLSTPGSLRNLEDDYAQKAMDDFLVHPMFGRDTATAYSILCKVGFLGNLLHP